MRVIVTGAAGGIGRATCARLRADGHEVIGVDVRDAEVIADLGTARGRAAMIEAVTGPLDGVVAGAGIMEGPDDDVVSVNYFGAVDTLNGLRPLLVEGGSAVAISSNSVTTQPGLPGALADACLAGDEEAARTAALRTRGISYASSKLALARWVRRESPRWAAAGLRLNAIAPGLIRTPMTEGSLEFIMGLGEVFPIPAGRPGRPEEVAALLAFLLSPDAAFFHGAFVVMDGGTEAAVRAEDWPATRGAAVPPPRRTG